ncbi:MAG: VOC family protein, partial [Acidobacteriota bacterium]
MTVTTPASSESATVGLAPDRFRLPATTRLGPIVLQIGDLDRSLDFYRTVLGLDVLRHDRVQTVLGSASGTPLVALREQPGARPKPRERSGLFHFALLLPDRAD